MTTNDWKRRFNRLKDKSKYSSNGVWHVSSEVVKLFIIDTFKERDLSLIAELEGMKWEMTGHDSINFYTAVVTESKEKVAHNAAIDLIITHLKEKTI